MSEMMIDSEISLCPAMVLAVGAWDIVISVGIFASVMLLVAAIFGQPGQIQLSPQREAALATGHTDRRTVFENTYLRPIMWLLLAASYRLAMPRAKKWLERKLLAAGSPNYYTAEEYLALAFLAGIVLAGSLEIFNMLLSSQFSFVTLIVGLVAGTALTVYQLHIRAIKRVRSISKRLPYALDLIALAMGAGATFTEAVQTIVKEEIDDPLNVELKAMLAEMELGTPRRVALQNLADRVPLDLLRGVLTSVAQAEQLGTPLGEVLHDQATLLRLQRSVRAETAAANASVRILLPGMLIAISVVLAVFAPFILKVVRGGLF